MVPIDAMEHLLIDQFFEEAFVLLNDWKEIIKVSLRTCADWQLYSIYYLKILVCFQVNIPLNPGLIIEDLVSFVVHDPKGCLEANRLQIKFVARSKSARLDGDADVWLLTIEELLKLLNRVYRHNRVANNRHNSAERRWKLIILVEIELDRLIKAIDPERAPSKKTDG